MLIDIFLPPKIKFYNSVFSLNQIFGKELIYASKGRFALEHIINSLNIQKGTILISPYICSTVLRILERMEMNILYYDIDLSDLNANVESVKAIISSTKIDAILIASMYGNPANLVEIEIICNKENIFLIDDAAQSFGSTLSSRMIGSFGDAGFISFSPGKPIVAHKGAYFWTSNTNYEIVYKKNNILVDYLLKSNFIYNRIYIYAVRNKLKGILLKYLSYFVSSYVLSPKTGISDYEKKIHPQLITNLLNGEFNFRLKYFELFLAKFLDNACFNVVRNERGIAHNHKFILIFKKQSIQNEFRMYLQKHDIYTNNGYPLLHLNQKTLPIAFSINHKVVEIPIEDSEYKNQQLFDLIDDFINNYEKNISNV